MRKIFIICKKKNKYLKKTKSLTSFYVNLETELKILN